MAGDREAGTTGEQRLGEQVRMARERRGWSQEEVSRRLREATHVNLHQSAIARIEGGKRIVRFNEALALAAVLDLDLRAFGAYGPRLMPEEVPSARERVKDLEQREGLAREELELIDSSHMRTRREVEARIAKFYSERAQLNSALQEYEARTSGGDSVGVDREAP